MAEKRVKKKSSDGGARVCVTKKVVDEGRDIIRFVNNLNYEDHRREAIVELGKICSNSSHGRDLVLAAGALAPLLALFNITRSDLPMQWVLTSTLSDLCKGNTHTAQFDVARTLLILVNLVNSSDALLLYYACRALHHLFEENNTEQKNRIKSLVSDDICNGLVKAMGHESDRVAIAALKAVRYLADERFIKIYCKMIQSEDSVVVLSCLKILRGILEQGEELKVLGYDGTNPSVQIWVNPNAKKIQDYQGFDRIRYLSSGRGLPFADEVFAEARKIIADYIPH